MILRALLAVAVTVAVPVALFGAEPGSPKAERSTRKICKVSSVIGSRLGGIRRCRTQAEWDEAQREARLAVDRYQHMKATICGGGRIKPPTQGGATTLGGECY